MWARDDYSVDQPSVSSLALQELEGSLNTGLGHMTADGRTWGHIVYREEGEYFVTGGFWAPEESCYFYYAT